MHSGKFELTKLTYTKLEDNLIRHRGDRLNISSWLSYSTTLAWPVLFAVLFAFSARWTKL